MKKIVLILLSALLLCGCAAPATQPTTIASAAATAPTQAQTVPQTTELAAETSAQPLPQPVLASQLHDGAYEIQVDSSSSMFNIVKCILKVENGAMTAEMTMSGQGYGLLYMGTGEEAAAAPEAEHIPFQLDADGSKVFIVPVEALNQEADCAAWSIRKEKWYDRVLVFRSEALPKSAFLEA